MGLTRDEAREKIYQHLKSIQGEIYTDNRFITHPEMEELDVDGWPFSWWLQNRNNPVLPTSYKRLVYAAVDNRSITPESLENILISARDYCGNSQSGGGRSIEDTELIIFAFTESITDDVREYIQKHKKIRNSIGMSPIYFNFLYVIDCPAKTPIYEEYPSINNRKRYKQQKRIVKNIINPSLN